MVKEGKLNELTHKSAGCRETREMSHCPTRNAILNEFSRDRISHSTTVSNPTRE